MILIALGSNLPAPGLETPLATCRAGLARLGRDVSLCQISAWYRSAPVPPSDQPWYVNAVARVETGLPPAGLLQCLHRVEAAFGRCRGARNAARTLDLDLLAYGRLVVSGPGPVLPHPRMHERAFVMVPLAEIAPDWRHPRLGLTAAALAAATGRAGLTRLADSMTPVPKPVA